MTLTVDDAPARWIEDEGRCAASAGFNWANFQQARTTPCATRSLRPRPSTGRSAHGRSNFGGEPGQAQTLARALAANGKETPAAKGWDKAINLPGATPVQIHQVGRSLLAEGKTQQALSIFQTDAKRFPGQWPVHVGLMRGYAAAGDAKKALDEGRLALKQAPDEPNKKGIADAIAKLEKGDTKIN